MRIFYTFLLLSLPLLSSAQNAACACCTAEHDQFDFWMGDWEVFDLKNQKLGENSIRKIEGDCILTEHWTGAKGTTGRSSNYYNPADSTWNQLWLDNQGTILVLKGKAAPNSMTLESDFVTAPSGAVYRNRIEWRLNDDGTVTQTWDAIGKDGAVLANVFKGIYRKKA